MSHRPPARAVTAAAAAALTLTVLGPLSVGLAGPAHADDDATGLIESLTALADGLGTAAAADAREARDARAGERRDADRRWLRRAADVEPGKVDGGAVVATGWWARANEQIETGLLAPPTVPAPAAPADTLPVTALGDDPQRLVALQFDLEGDTGDVVTSLQLALAESADPTANLGSATARVQACTLTDSGFVPVVNGPWATRPTYDCENGVAGERDDEGVWRFDLTPLAADWLSEDRLFGTAVVLVNTPAVIGEAPGTFQVGFDALQGGLVATTRPGPEEPEEPGEETPEEPAEPEPTEPIDSGEPTPVPDGGGGGLGTPSAGGPVSSDPIEGIPSADGPEVVDAAPVDTDEALGDVAAPAFAPVAAPVLSWFDGLGLRTLFLLVLALGLAYVTMLTLGPAGRPVAVSGRSRGVSRALDRLAQLRPGTNRTSS